MRRAFLVTALAALALAKPELYREKEDFQYSRSSSDDGTKAGYYGAQRGNMGGNYEKAHNMDNLAQHQMSGLVSQVHGELGDASKTKSGSVYTASNSRGLYGNGIYDTRNLYGRNFQEGVSIDDSQSALHGLSGSSSTAQQSEAYSSGSRSYDSSRYQATGQQGDRLLHTNANTGNEYDARLREGYTSGSSLQSGYHQQSASEQSSLNQHSSNSGSNVQSRLISRTPVRVVVRPGTRVDVPVAAQTYDASQSALSYDQNAVNGESEVLSNSGHQSDYRPSNNAKHYESAYSYRKEWEKHNSNPAVAPLSVPTENPFARHSELNDNALGEILSESQRRESGMNSQSAHSSNIYSGYNADVKSSSSSRSQADYNAQRQSSAGYNSRDYANSGANADLTSIQGVDTRPKSYSSSYSYHKAWERQGDPYVIKPVGGYDGQASQRFTAGSSNQGAYSQQFGSHKQSHHQRYVQGSLVDCDCDEDGHIRVARSAGQQPVEPYQQSQNQYDGQEELGQQTQNGWENLEDLGQQSQSQWDNIEDLGQQTQDLGQQTQDLGQQTQNTWDKFEVAGQQTQNKWDKIEDLGQQTQNKWDKFEDLGQQTQKDLEQIPQDHQPHELEELGQQTQNNWDNLDQQVQDQRNQMSDQKQQTYKESENSHQTFRKENDTIHTSQVQNTWEKLNSLDMYNNVQTGKEQPEKNDQVTTPTYKNPPNQAQSTWNKIDSLDMNHNTQVNDEKFDKSPGQVQQVTTPTYKNPSSHAQGTWDKLNSPEINHNTQVHNDNSDTNNQQTSKPKDKYNPSQVQSTWDKLDNSFYQNTQNINNDNHNSDQQSQVGNEKDDNLGQDHHGVQQETDGIDISSQVHTQDKLDTLSQHKKVIIENDGKINNNEQSTSDLNHNLEQQNKENSNQGSQSTRGFDRGYTYTHHGQNHIPEKQNNRVEVHTTYGDNIPQTNIYGYQGANGNDQSLWDFINKLDQQSKEENHNHDSQSTYTNDKWQTNVYTYQGVNSNDQSLWDFIHKLEQQNNENLNPEPQLIHGNNKWYTHTYQGQNLVDFIHKLEQQYKDNSNQQVQTNYGNDNWYSNGYTGMHPHYGMEGDYYNHFNFDHDLELHSQDTSQQSSWDNLHTNEKEYSMSNNNNDRFGVNVNDNYYPQGYTGSQHNHQQTYHFMSNSDSSQNPFHHNHFQSHYGGYRPYFTSTNNAGIDTIGVPINTVVSSTSSTTGIPKTTVSTTTEKSTIIRGSTNTVSNKGEDSIRGDIDDEQIDEDLRPQDIGRGDIGAEVSRTTEKNRKNDDTKPLHTYTSQSVDKPYKTQEEIQALSLMGDKLNSTDGNNKHEINADEDNVQQFDSSLSVLSISQQKLLDEERRHGDRFQNNEKSSTSTVTPSTTTKSSTNTQHFGINENSRNENNQSQIQSENFQVQRTGIYSNKPISHDTVAIPVAPIPDSQETSMTPKQYHEEDTYSNVGLEQSPVEIEQQNMEQQFEQFDFGQQSENLDQQSQSQWGQNTDLGQEGQSAWEQSETQQIQDFAELNKDHEQKQDFYHEKIDIPNDNSKVPDSQKDKISNSVPPEKAEVEILSPPEASTEQPGFWKSVGNKFTSAKDKVSSWFKKS